MNSTTYNMDYIDKYRQTLKQQDGSGDTEDHIRARDDFYAGAKLDVKKAIDCGDIVPVDWVEYLNEMNRGYVTITDGMKKDILSENPRYSAGELAEKYGFSTSIVYKLRAKNIQ